MNELIAPGKLELEKFWLDPKNIMSPIKIENVLGIHLEPSGNDALDAYLKKIRPMTLTIETLSINPSGLNKPWNFDWIESFKNLKKITITNRCVDYFGEEEEILDCKKKILVSDFSSFWDVLKKIDRMKMIEFGCCNFEKESFGPLLKQLPPSQSLIIQDNCYFIFPITSLLEILNSLGEMKEKKILKINMIVGEAGLDDEENWDEEEKFGS